MTATPPVSLNSIEQIKRAAQEHGSHFFDRDTMRHFGSRVAPDVYPIEDGAACLFITSEADSRGFMGAQAWGGARRYTVRLAFFSPTQVRPECGKPCCDGFTLAEPVPPQAEKIDAFGFFPNLAQARSFARKLKAAGCKARDLVAPCYFTKNGSTQAPACPLEA